MTLFAVNLSVALCWSLVTGELSVSNLVLGYAAGFAVLWLLEPVHGDSDYHRRPWRVLAFIAWYLGDLLRANLRLARSIFSPVSTLRDGWFEVHLATGRDIEIVLLANLITLTPGTLVVDVSPDRATLLVHALMRRGDEDAVVEDDLAKLQRRLLRLFGHK